MPWLTLGPSVSAALRRPAVPGCIVIPAAERSRIRGRATRPVGRLARAAIRRTAPAAVLCSWHMVPGAPGITLSGPQIRLTGRRFEDGLIPLHQRPGKIRARDRGDPFADLFAQRAGLDLLHRAVRQVAQLERPIGHADQAIYRQPQVTQHVTDLAVLAFSHGEREPDIGALLAIERRLDRPVMDTVDFDAAAQ